MIFPTLTVMIDYNQDEERLARIDRILEGLLQESERVRKDLRTKAGQGSGQDSVELTASSAGSRHIPAREPWADQRRHPRAIAE